MRGRLTAEQLRGVYGLDVDVLTVSFPALTRDTATFLDTLAGLCGTAAFGAVEERVANASVRARLLPLAALGKAAAVVLRWFGFRRTLQWLKDNRGLKDNRAVRTLFFAPFTGQRERPPLSASNEAILEDAYRECRATVEAHSEAVCKGVWFRRAGA